MPDKFTPQERSRIMARVKSRDTAPEKMVRKILHRMGYRFRLRSAKLPGKPDVILPKHKKIVFVHGCFWHGHEGCRRSLRPASNSEYWNRKIDRNIARDARVQQELKEMGWKVLVIWQCQMRDASTVEERLEGFLNNSAA
jgi:DNA mismatch endonuclease (patch repair protein)